MRQSKLSRTQATRTGITGTYLSNITKRKQTSKKHQLKGQRALLQLKLDMARSHLEMHVKERACLQPNLLEQKLALAVQAVLIAVQNEAAPSQSHTGAYKSEHDDIRKMELLANLLVETDTAFLDRTLTSQTKYQSFLNNNDMSKKTLADICFMPHIFWRLLAVAGSTMQLILLVACLVFGMVMPQPNLNILRKDVYMFTGFLGFIWCMGVDQVLCLIQAQEEKQPQKAAYQFLEQLQAITDTAPIVQTIPTLSVAEAEIPDSCCINIPLLTNKARHASPQFFTQLRESLAPPPTIWHADTQPVQHRVSLAPTR